MSLMLVMSAHALRVNYFAYGSNLSREVLQGRRNIQPFGQCRGYLRDYRLAFNLAEGMASAEPSEGDVLHGVVYSLTPRDWLRLCASEAVPLIYSTEPVRVQLYDRADAARCLSYGFEVVDEVIEAYTLQVTKGPWRRDGRPSRRYADLLRSGARQNQLDKDWVARLDALEVTT